MAARCRHGLIAPFPTHAFFGTSKGVPIEIAVELANAVSADAWMNVPVMADDNYISQMATLVHSQLGSSQKIYVELSNEVWNVSFSQYKYAVESGPSSLAYTVIGRGSYEYNRQWYGMRTAQMCDIWRSVWRSEPRLVCVLGAQAAWSFSAIRGIEMPVLDSGRSLFRTCDQCGGHSALHGRRRTFGLDIAG